MRELTAHPGNTRPHGNKALIPVVLLLVLAASAILILAYRQLIPANPKTPAISLTTLEEQYGVKINLIGVTAAGGLVDLRLKVVNAAKAGQLMQDNSAYPVLIVNNGRVILTPARENPQEELRVEDGGNIYLLFPNAGNAVKPGTNVTVRFGEINVEPIAAQ